MKYLNIIEFKLYPPSFYFVPSLMSAKPCRFPLPCINNHITNVQSNLTKTGWMQHKLCFLAGSSISSQVSRLEKGGNYVKSICKTNMFCPQNYSPPLQTAAKQDLRYVVVKKRNQTASNLSFIVSILRLDTCRLIFIAFFTSQYFIFPTILFQSF